MKSTIISWDGSLVKLPSLCHSHRFQPVVPKRRGQNKNIHEPPHDKTNRMAFAPREDSDQTGHPPSLIRVFAVRMKKHWVLSYPLSALRRLWSDLVIWVFAGHKGHFVGFVMRWLTCTSFTHPKKLPAHRPNSSTCMYIIYTLLNLCLWSNPVGWNRSHGLSILQLMTNMRLPFAW